MKMTKTTQRNIEEQGFYLGTQEDGSGLAPQAAEAEIQASFTEQQEQARQRAEPRLKQLEARVETLTSQLAEAEPLWQAFAALSRVAPPFVLALLAVIGAGLTIVGEGLFLAPVLDGLGTTEPWEQKLLAGVIVLTASGLLKVMLHRLLPPTKPVLSHARETAATTSPWQQRIGHGLTGLLTALAFSLLLVLGWWRAEELIYGATLNPTLGGFLSQNAMLTRVCVILLTLGLPVFVAATLNWG
jgi:hypothetical protein